MASSEAEFPGSRNTSAWEGFKMFVWDSEKRAFLGRNSKSWCKCFNAITRRITVDVDIVYWTEQTGNAI